jgi:uncharacterized protein YwqG
MSNSSQNAGWFLEKVEVANGIHLSRALAEYWPNILQTKRTFVEIKATPSAGLNLRQSSFGHYTFLPKGFPYPEDSQGNFMYPLAQINFSEVPAMPFLPRSGYLQFYISASEDFLYGADFRYPMIQRDFRILFFEESDVDDPLTDFSFLAEVITGKWTPIDMSHSLSFSISDGYMGPEEISFEKSFDFKAALMEKYPALMDDLEDELLETFAAYGHRMGGYAHFTQTDPRIHDTELAPFLLLLQMDGDDNIMWGDGGVGNFFIHPDALAKKDFSRVLYNWDCG